MTVEEILARLRAAGSAENVAGMARFGICPAVAYGVTAPEIRSVAREIKRDHETAKKLWGTGVLEARILATMIADWRVVSEEEIEAWVQEFDCWSVCDSTCSNLLWRTPFAWRKVVEWSDAKPEYVRRAAFALIAALTVHDKKAPDSRFRAAFRLIRKAATDERNYVKKAVNWALRQIGKRNATLYREAMEVAAKLAASKSRSARWIGSDALRELRARDPLNPRFTTNKAKARHKA